MKTPGSEKTAKTTALLSQDPISNAFIVRALTPQRQLSIYAQET